MSFLDKIAASVMPAASAEDRLSARQNAAALARGDDWLGQILDHHRAIEAALERGMSAAGFAERKAALKQICTLLTGHSTAEEAVIYPAIVEHSGKAHATMAYEEQAMTKVQLYKLEQIDPTSDDWRDKLEHIQSAIAQHVYQEESEWFPDVVRNAPQSVQDLLTNRYREEFQRYGAGKSGTPTLSKADTAAMKLA
jgi:Hemerythrin HHE cation binding domain